jgi:hypothetical protein
LVLAKRTVQIYGGKWERKRINPIPAVKTLVVTGTPILNYPPELFTALRHLDPAQWGHRYKTFVNEWYESDAWSTYRIDETLRVFGETRNLDQYQRKLRNTVMVREYLEGLPPKIYKVKVIPPTWEDVDYFMARSLALNLIRDKLRRTKKKSKRAAIRLRLNQTYENARKRTADRKYPHQRNDLLALPTNFKKLIFCLHDHIVQRFEKDFRAAGRTFITLTGKIGDARYASRSSSRTTRILSSSSATFEQVVSALICMPRTMLCLLNWIGFRGLWSKPKTGHIVAVKQSK